MTTGVSYSLLTISVQFLGAKGDGVTDDSAAFAAAAALGGVIDVPYTPNGYLINTPFALGSNTTLRGVGRPTLKTTVAGNQIVSAAGTAGTPLANITIDGIIFQGAGSATPPNNSIGGFASTSTGLVTLAYVNDARILNCEASAFWNGFATLQCTRVWVNRNRVRNWFVYGIIGSLSSEAEFDHNVVDTCDLALVVTFTGAPAAAATSATLNTAWTGTTGAYTLQFLETVSGNPEMRAVTLTNGLTTATWTTPLVNACNATTGGSCYGIMVTGNENGSTPSKGISICHNRIWNIPAWDGVMSHDVNGLTVIGNDIRNVRNGVDITYNGTLTYLRNLVVANNYVECTTTNVWFNTGASSVGVYANGFNASYLIDTAVIANNIIRNFGNITNGNISGNPGGIVASLINDGVVSGNLIEGTGTVGGYAGIYAPGQVNALTIIGNTLRGSHAGAGIRLAGSTVNQLSIAANAIAQVTATDAAVSITTSTVASLALGENTTNSSVPFTQTGSTLTYANNGQGSFTPSAATSFVVTDARATANCKVMLTPTNALAATVQGSAKCAYISAKAAGSFTVATANAVAFGGTETYDYQIS